MKNQKTQSKLIVAMSAVILLLVALSATLTFAYFTSFVASTDDDGFQFGTLSLSADGENGALNLAAADIAHELNGEVTPGCTINLSGSLALTGNLDAFVRTTFKVMVLKNGYSADTDKLAAAAYGVLEESAQANYTEFGGNYYLTSKVAQVATEGLATINATNAQNNHAKYIFSLIKSQFVTSGEGTLAAAANDWIEYQGYSYYKQKVTADPNGLTLLSFANKSITLDPALTNSWQGEKIIVLFGAEAIQANHIAAVETEMSGQDSMSENAVLVPASTAELSANQIKIDAFVTATSGIWTSTPNTDTQA
jgi:hypothetical protein